MPQGKYSSEDMLTGLPGKEDFYELGQRIVDEHGVEGICAVYARLINLGTFNMRRGSKAGDAAVLQVASSMGEARSVLALGRFASGSFVAIAPTEVVEGVLEGINQRLPSAGEADGLVLKAGYCALREDLTLDETMMRARYAYEDIRMGRTAYTRLFDPGLETVYNKHAYVVEHLGDAIARGEIRAHAQSIVRVLTGMICEVEILARWESEEFGFLRPDEFIPELERHRLIHQLDAEVIRLACKQWSEASALGVNVPFGINLSRLDFELCDMYAVVRGCMDDYGVPVEQVHVEITESALAQNSELLMEGIERFRHAGFQLYLDDFGSGYSSLQVLEGTSFDVVKLDMSLLREVEQNERARVIVADAISMAKRLGLQTLCEGVETEEQFLFLKAVGCEKVQGYLFGKPMSHEEIMAHLEETAILHESAEDKRYFDSIGKVNLIDGTRSSVHGVEAAHFLGTQPFAILEIRGQSVSFLSANVAFSHFTQKSFGRSMEQLQDALADDLSSLRNKLLYAASKAMTEDAKQSFDIVAHGNFLTFGITHVESSIGRDAFLLDILSVAKYSQFNDFSLLEESLRFLYTIFKRIDLLDVDDQTWRNIYLNVPRYNALRAGATPQDEIDAFAATFIHPDERSRFLTFYDLDTAEERLLESPTAYLSDVFFALSDNNRYEDQLFMIIPVSLDGHRQYLSCMRDLDRVGLQSQRPGAGGHISDEVLLSGILGVTERNIFWKDTKGRFVGANQRFLDYYGMPSVEAILGKTGEELGWARSVRYAEDERRVIAGEHIIDTEGDTLRRGELRRIRVSKMPLWNEGKVIGLVGFVVDVGPAKVRP